MIGVKELVLSFVGVGYFSVGMSRACPKRVFLLGFLSVMASLI